MKIYFFIVVFCLITVQTIQGQTKRPNIILIVADDLGYSDLGCYGGEIKTPALDRMAKEGLRLTHMNNAGMCVVSRSSMLTGKWWPKADVTTTTDPNLAQALKKVGYRTGLVGKWHLGGEPNRKGFDFFFGFLGGYSSYFEGSKDYRLNQQQFQDFGIDYYSTDAFTDRAIEFIKPGESKTDTPFFLYLSYQSPHNPLQAPKEDIMKYRGTYLKGWQAIRDARIKNQIKLGIVKPGTPLPAFPQNLPPWESLTPAQKDLEDLRMSVYASMVERMDKGIGKLIQALEANDQADNTFIIFLSDNGTDSFSVMDAVMLQRNLLPGDKGSNYQPGTGWAYASVSPWRLYKISQHGGGIKTGAIAWWPKGIKKPGAVLADPLHVVDLMPTILDIARDAGTDMGEFQNIDSLSGQSFMPLLQGENWSRKSPMYFQFMDNRAIRTKKWSLVEVDGNGWELYDLNYDPFETNDLSEKIGHVVNSLDEDWLNWWKTESKTEKYEPKSTAENPHYSPQGDRGSGSIYTPSAMPDELSNTYKIQTNKK
ncbi:MAG: arylsulfatase [Saonia sp.]